MISIICFTKRRRFIWVAKLAYAWINFLNECSWDTRSPST